MTIDNRELAPGTKLVGTYKKTAYVCEVVTTPEGENRFRLEDGRLFTSPSSAAKAVMNGVSANGWRFWRLASEDGDSTPSPTNAGASRRKPPTSRLRQIKKVPNQKGVEEGPRRPV